MADARLPLLRGHISQINDYLSPTQGAGKQVPLPDRDPARHKAFLLKQLDAVAQQVRARAVGTRDGRAWRELIAVYPAPDTSLAPEQLSRASADVRLVGRDPVTGVVVLDALQVRLEHLRSKIEAFADDARVKVKTAKDGSTTVIRAAARAIAPIEGIGLATVADRAGPELRAALEDNRLRWYEIACRGGYRNSPGMSDGSRVQIARQLPRVGAPQKLEEFLGPEQIYFFLRLTSTQLSALAEATDCIYEIDLAPPALRDLHLIDEIYTSDLRDYRLTPPPSDAPAVVILDTGIATGHPMLAPAILSATAAGIEIPSAEDTHGHGTMMAGLCLYRDVGAAVEARGEEAAHWLQSARLLVAPGQGTGADENHESWPVMTLGAVLSAERADSKERNRIFTLAVTRSMQDPPLDDLGPTLWSQAIDQIAFNEGRGRLVLVSAGNAREHQWLTLAEQYPAFHLTEKVHQPAQASNALTVGAYTLRVTIPKTRDYEEMVPVARRAGGISPYTSTGMLDKSWSIKPDIVMEGGNLAVHPNSLYDARVPTLSALTTSLRHTLGSPLGLMSMTSEATARTAHLAASIWSVEPKLRPETVRGLLVHAASWTNEMLSQFTIIDDRAVACGYGVPDEDFARACATDRATIIVEDELPNAVSEQEPKKRTPKRASTTTTEPRLKRKIKFFRLPVPGTLLSDVDPDVELRVTLSYFAEPNKFRRRILHGLNLKWDMQGPQESEAQFIERINALHRPKNAAGKPARTSKSKSFPWELGPQLRSRGTVQSDRFRGKMSSLVGDKLIAVIPRLGWWEQREELRFSAMRFSLIVTVCGPGVHGSIKPRLTLTVEPTVEI